MAKGVVSSRRRSPAWRVVQTLSCASLSLCAPDFPTVLPGTSQDSDHYWSVVTSQDSDQ